MKTTSCEVNPESCEETPDKRAIPGGRDCRQNIHTTWKASTIECSDTHRHDSGCHTFDHHIQGLFKDFIQLCQNLRTFNALKMKEVFFQDFQTFSRMWGP